MWKGIDRQPKRNMDDVDRVLRNGPRRELNVLPVADLYRWVNGTGSLICCLPIDGNTTIEEAEFRANKAYRSTVVSAILAGKICNEGPGVFCNGRFDKMVVSPLRLERAISKRKRGC